MSKIITSPVKKWPGTVTISNPLTFPQIQIIEDAADQQMEIIDKLKEGSKVWNSKMDQIKIPSILACVEEWNLEGFTPDPFPATPRKESSELISWIFSEIQNIYNGELEAAPPNA